MQRKIETWPSPFDVKVSQEPISFWGETISSGIFFLDPVLLAGNSGKVLCCPASSVREFYAEGGLNWVVHQCLPKLRVACAGSGINS
jgi:hypothetical protein